MPEQLRGFGVPGILAIAVIMLTGTVYVGNMVAVPVGAALVLVWAKLSHTPWREIGFVPPRSWIVGVVAGVALGVALKFLMKAIVMPLLGAPPVNHAFQFLAGNHALLPAALWMMLVAGFAEETIWRGFLFERLGKLFGPGAPARAAIVVITSAAFGLAHYSGQGLPGVQQATIVAAVRHDLCSGRAPVHTDGHARRVRPHGAGDNLLAARDVHRTSGLQIGSSGRLPSRPYSKLSFSMSSDVRARLLVFLLRLAGVITVTAFFAIVLPVEWMAASHQRLGLGEFPRAPVVVYLARSVAALYGFHGVLILLVSTDPVKYRAIVSYIAAMNVLFGLIVFGIDLHAGMPAYWTFGEGPPITAFGIVIAYLNLKNRRRD